MVILAGIILGLTAVYIIYLITQFLVQQNQVHKDVETLGLGDMEKLLGTGDTNLRKAMEQYNKMIDEHVDELYNQMSVPKNQMNPPFDTGSMTRGVKRYPKPPKPSWFEEPDTNTETELSKEQRKAIVSVFLPTIRKKDPLDILHMPNNIYKICELERKLENILVEGTYTESQKEILNTLRRLKRDGIEPFGD